MSNPRLPWTNIAPQAYHALVGVSAAIADHSLGARLYELIQARVSQINGCAYCLDMHIRDLRSAGESWQRISALPAWRDVRLFDARERAALHWAESLSRLSESHGERDSAFAALQVHFSAAEIVQLTVLIAQINAWNRMGVGMQPPVAERPIA